MNPYILVLGLGVVALVQVSLLPAFAVMGVPPDLALTIVVSWALLRGARSAIIWALVAGLWLDLLSGGPFGMYALGLMVAAGVAGLGGNMMFLGSTNFFLPIAMAALATLAQSLVYWLILLLTGDAVSVLDMGLRIVLPQIVYNAALIIVVYPIVARISRATGQERLPLE